MNNQLTKLRILKERAERELQAAEKAAAAQIEEIRQMVRPLENKVSGLQSDYFHALEQAGFCGVCGRSKENCEGHLMMARESELLRNE